jgi:hypothetical protein
MKPGLRILLAAAFCVTSTAALPLAAQVPPPEQYLGFRPGADHMLAGYEPIERYFRALGEASDRVIIEEIGASTLGRPLLLAVISSEENLRARERYREISRRLALARDLTADEARALAREGKIIIWIDGGLHATEVAHGQMTPELAHWLATDESAEARRIRENAIVLVMPNMNPDGLDIVANWYMGNVGTPYETAPVPELYHPYIGHDNNRDWYMFTQVESQAVAHQLYHVWFPQIVYNHHQSSPFPGRIWGPPFADPVNPNLDPLVVSGLNRIGEAMRTRFDFEGLPGYNSGIVFDLWWNGSMRGGPNFHNMLGFLTETALYRYATPYCYDESEVPDDFGARAGNLPAKIPSTSYTNPWLGGCWHLRDAIDYMLIASRAVMDHGATLSEELLYNAYHIGARQIARGERAEGGPFAYVIDPRVQHDAGTAIELLRTFRLGGIEVRRADAPFSAGGRQYDAGTFVIGPQAFRPFVVDLMEPKQFPDRRQYPGGPPIPPYDMTGYELSLQMGVHADRVAQPFALPPIATEIATPDGGVRGSGGWGYLLGRESNAAVLAANRLLAHGARLASTASPMQQAGRDWPAGTLVISGGSRDAAHDVGRALGLELHALDAPPAVELHELRAPRIGIYRSHAAPMPEGWTRWLLEQYDFDYDSLTDADLRGDALDGYDIIIVPDQGARAIVRGHEPGTMPEAYVGGMGDAGVAALRRFVENGGWLLTFNASIDFAIEAFGLPVRNVTAGLPTERFFIPGSLVRVDVESTDPLAHGMRSDAIAMFARSQVMALEPLPANTGSSGAGQAAAGSGARIGEPVVYARYTARDFLASGWALGGEEHLAGQIAALRVPVGAGQVVLLAFSPHFRGQPHNTYKLLFNPLFAATMR